MEIQEDARLTQSGQVHAVFVLEADRTWHSVRAAASPTLSTRSSKSFARSMTIWQVVRTGGLCGGAVTWTDYRKTTVHQLITAVFAHK